MFLPQCADLRKRALLLNVCSLNHLAMARTQGSHSDITGPRVRAAALKLFAKGGYAAVSMRAIAAEVGVQAGALYNYTPDKQSLLFDLMQAHMSDLLAEMPQSRDQDPVTQLHGFVDFHIGFHADRSDEIFIAYMELRNLNAANFARVEAMRRRYEDRLEAILRAGVEAGVFAVADTKIVTLAIIAMLTGVNTWFRTGGRLSLEEVSAQYWDMVRKAVAAPQGAGVIQRAR